MVVPFSGHMPRPGQLLLDQKSKDKNPVWVWLKQAQAHSRPYKEMITN